MRFEIYGYTKEALNLAKWNEKNGEFLGFYDGMEFKSDKFEVQQLEEWDYLHLFVGEKIHSHQPKRFNKNILKVLEGNFTRTFGEIIQMSLI